MIILAVLWWLSDSASGASQELEKLRHTTREILSARHCVSCHSSLGARPTVRAMKVYNLDSAAWFSSLSQRQFEELQRRLLAINTPAELMEMGWDKDEPPLSSSQKKLVSDFIKLEIENRTLNPFERVLGH